MLETLPLYLPVFFSLVTLIMLLSHLAAIRQMIVHADSQ